MVGGETLIKNNDAIVCVIKMYYPAYFGFNRLC